MKLDYRKQMALSIILILLFDVLNTAMKHWIFTSIGYCLCGLLWLVHPVLMKTAAPTEKNLRLVRLCGVILILIGIFTRSHY